LEGKVIRAGVVIAAVDAEKAESLDVPKLLTGPCQTVMGVFLKKIKKSHRDPKETGGFF
jgi:hypothetical protein